MRFIDRFQISGHWYGVAPRPPFAAITAATILGRLSTRLWSVSGGISAHSATRELGRPGTGVQWIYLAWLADCIRIYPKCVWWCLVQGSVQTCQVFPIWWNISVWTSLCAWGHYPANQLWDMLFMVLRWSLWFYCWKYKKYCWKHNI